MTISIKIHPAVQDFFVAKFGSYHIKLKQSDVLSIRIKNMLQLNPKNYRFHYRNIDYNSELVLELPANFKITDKWIDTQYRNYLDDRRRYMIAREFQQWMKDIFHNYVAGYCVAHNFKPGVQKEAILSFLVTYKIQMNDINYEMLKKSWDRSNEKSMSFIAVC